MKKLGYTFYPKDWQTSDSVFELNLSERGLYRELIDLAMLNDNKVQINLPVWSRKWGASIDDISQILTRLKELNLIKIDNNILFIFSCENRLKLSRAGRKGGKKKKPNCKPLVKPIAKPTIKPNANQRERERENKREIKKKIIEGSFDFVFSEFVKMRKKKKAPPTDYALQKILKKLEKLSGGNEKTKIEILNQSIINNWTDIYPLKKENDHRPRIEADKNQTVQPKIKVYGEL